METVMERECSALGGLFQTVVGDMKNSYPVWDDFISKAGKLQSQLRTTVVTVAAFLDAFQKVADLATNSRGGTRDIGSTLTRMCMRQRSLEAKLRHFSMMFLDCLINPLQEQMEEWKRVSTSLDKDHAKEYKKARQEIKKRSADTMKLQKKAKKGDMFVPVPQKKGGERVVVPKHGPQLHSAQQDVSDSYLLLQEAQRQAVRRALLEERGRFCCLVALLRPLVEEELTLLGEVAPLRSLNEDLRSLTMDPHKLPPSSEQVIVDLKGSECTWSYQTPPSSPSTTVSRKSSMCSSLNSVNSSESPSSPTSSQFRYRASSSSSCSSSALPPPAGPPRLSSVSSHDSGFVSQDALQSKSPSPMPPPDAGLLSDGSDQHTAPYLLGAVLQGPSITSISSYCCTSPISSSPACSPVSPGWAWSCGSGPAPFSSLVPSWKDWAKPGPYDQPGANPLRRGRDRRETTDPSSHQGADVISPGEEPHPARRAKEEREVHEELARVLARGLQLNTSGRDPLPVSSGNSSQTTTPCHGPDCDYFSVGGALEAELQQGEAAPRHSHAGQTHRRRRGPQGPLSPSSPCGVAVTPGVATIRRAPSSKPHLRRPPGTLSLGGPVRPPMIPVKTPTVPEHAGFPPPSSPSSSLPGAEGGVFSPSPLTPQRDRTLPGLQEEEGEGAGEDVLAAIRRGVRLKRTATDDRSAPRIL